MFLNEQFSLFDFVRDNQVDLLFLLSAVSEVIAGIFYCKKEVVQNNRQIFKQFSAGMREQEKIQIALSAVMVC